MKLYELSENFTKLFEKYEEFANYEPDQDENGNYIDSNGEIIEDVVAYRELLIEAWFDNLEDIEEDFMCKAENIAVCIKSMQAEADAIKAEERRLAERRKVKEKSAERLKEYVLGEMKRINLKKVDGVRAKITYSAGRNSVNIIDEKEFCRWADSNRQDLLIYSDPKVCKNAVMTELSAGKDIPFASIVRKPYITIK